MEYKTLTFERRNRIGILRLNRPERLNALSLEMIAELRELLAQLCDDVETRVVIIRGEGRAFCSGIDLKHMVAGFEGRGSLGEVQHLYLKMQHPAADIVRKMRQIPQPLIAAVHGAAAGGGLSIALACDVRIAAESARFNAAFIRIGLTGGDLASTYFLPRLIGMSRAAEYLLTGRFMDAATAERIGLVSRVVPDGQLEAAALDLATEMLRTSPLGLRLTKELLNANVDAAGLEAAIQLENRSQVLCCLTDDAKEGPRAFVEKRPPHYQDR